MNKKIAQYSALAVAVAAGEINSLQERQNANKFY